MNKMIEDLTETEKTEYERLQNEIDALEPLLDSYDFKNKIETKKEVLAKYLTLSKAQNDIVPHGRKRKLKDKFIKETFDFCLSALELKEKSYEKYLRLKANFNHMISEKMRKARK